MTRMMILIATAALLAGCAANPKAERSAMSATPTGEQIEAIRQAFRISYPNARVGVVTAVQNEARYVLVTQIETTSVRRGTVFTFLDADQAVITNGVVMKSDKDSLTIYYDAGKRPLRVGDAAVRF